MQPYLHGSRVGAGQVGDLARIEALDREEEEGDAKGERQPLQRGDQVGQQSLGALRIAVGSGHISNERQDPDSTAPTVEIDGRVPGDPFDPERKRVAVLQGGPSRVDPQEDLLGCILGLVVVADESFRLAVDRASVVTVDLLEVVAGRSRWPGGHGRLSIYLHSECSGTAGQARSGVATVSPARGRI